MKLLHHPVISLITCLFCGLLRSVTSQLHCDPQFQNWTVASTTDATDLSQATDCAGGVFSVTWVGHVVVTAEIPVLTGTTLTVTGEGLNATADGDGVTRIFRVWSAMFEAENMSFVNGYRNGSDFLSEGGGIAVLDSAATFRGRTVFNSNRSYRGGAIYALRSHVTWTGDMTFDNNTAQLFQGGGIFVYQGSFNGTGTIAFQNNYAGTAGGAVKLAWSDMSCIGHTSFVDNNSGINGGAISATDSSTGFFSGKTMFSNNSAPKGGAVSLAGDSLNPTRFTWQGNTMFSNNHATENGGALSVALQCEVAWNDSMVFAGNTAGNNGGGVVIDGDSKLSSAGSTVFFGNSATSSGGAVYSIGNIEGFSYVGSTFENNLAAMGGAIASYSTGKGSSNTYTECVFKHNSATFFGGAMEASTGQDDISNSSFVGNSAGTGGALSLSGSVILDNVTFESNVAIEGLGPAVRNIGRILNMTNVVFKNNYFFCSEGQYLDIVQNDCEHERYAVVCDGCLEWTDCDACGIENGTSKPDCLEAPEHTSAVPGTTLETLDIDSGYYRSSTHTNITHKCYNEKACLGGQTGSLEYCAIGYKGPYCAVCQDGYATSQAFTCDSCSGSRRTVVVTISIVVMILGAGVVYLIMVHLVTPDSRENKIGLFRNNLLRRVPLPALTAVKIVITVWQILTQFSEVANVTYPEAYEEFLEVLDIFNVDVGSLFSFGCLWDGIDFHDRLILSTLGPLVILELLSITYMLALRATDTTSEDSRRRTKEKHVSLVLLLTFFVYSSVSSIVFQTFACETLEDGNEYLRADYRILCTDRKHRALQAYAGFMIILYPFGIPLFYLFLMYRVRSILGDGEARSLSGDAEQIKDLWEPYRPECFYYEVVECLRRIMSTGVVVFIYPGDAAQIAVTIALTFVFFLISEVLSPYASSWNTWLSRVGHVIVFCSFYIALLNRVDVSSERKVSQEIFGGVLVAVHVCLFIFVLLSGVAHWLSQGPIEVSPEIPVRRTSSRLFRQSGRRDVVGVELVPGDWTTSPAPRATVTGAQS